MRYHHIWELITDKKIDIRKVDTKVNIANSHKKQLPDQCFDMLRQQMWLHQANERNGAEYEGAEGKSKNGTAKQAKSAKSKEPNNQKAEDEVELEEAERMKEDQRTKGEGSRKPIKDLEGDMRTSQQQRNPKAKWHKADSTSADSATSGSACNIQINNLNLRCI